VGVLQDFERRLEGAVEGFFARAFRSGLQPVEMAKALQRYAEDYQHVTEDGVVIPNVYRFSIAAKDADRLDTFGDSLRDELARVVVRTAEERRWELRGPVIVKLDRADKVTYGTYELAGRVEAVEGEPSAPAPSPAKVAPGRPARGGLSIRILGGATAGTDVPLSGSRIVVGRMDDCPVHLDDPTVSRKHAAFVRRGDDWWVVDLDSTNGTRVNGVNAAEQPLRPGDRVEFGDAAVELVEA